VSEQLDELTIRIADLDEVLALRTEVLIRGSDRVSPHFDRDDADDTRHFGAFLQTSNIACASVMSAQFNGGPGWQLRGMATHEAYRSRGLGRQLLKFIELEVDAAGASNLLWCNARVGAVAFYERAGWETVSDVFEVESVGPHRRMTKKLSAGA
jgi:predicted GNAT family N-acyltransferase